MRGGSRPTPGDAPADNGTCAYLIDDDASAAHRVCGSACRPGSSYCDRHHALCYLPPGSLAEQRQLREIDALATVVGGRRGRPANRPPAGMLRRLERLERAFAQRTRSRIVQEKPMPALPRRSHQQPPASCDGPPPERRQHGPIEQLPSAIADVSGRPSRPYRAVDTLTLMERRGTITAGMRQAGEDFRARFATAQLDPLRALDLAHVRLGEGTARPDRDAPGLRIEAARRAVWRAIQAVGGIASPAGSCLWHVLGWERSVKEWALEQGWSGKRVSQEAGSGILVAALGALEVHFGGTVYSKQQFSVDKSGSK